MNFHVMKSWIISQMRRAAVSIPSNIAEGHARSSTAEFMHFITIASGSIAELETQVILSHDFRYMDIDNKHNILDLLNTIEKCYEDYISRWKYENKEWGQKEW